MKKLNIWKTYKEFKAQVANQLQTQYSKPECGQAFYNCQLQVFAVDFKNSQCLPGRQVCTGCVKTPEFKAVALLSD